MDYVVFFHWSTNSYSQHKALGHYYDNIVEVVDDLAEAYMGKYEQLKNFPNVYHQPKEPVKYLESLKSFVADARNDLPTDKDIQTLIDNVATEIDSTLYKLRFLK